MWVTDFGWGQIESVRSLELAKLGSRGEAQRLAHRGAATALYASPQQAKKEAPFPTDDVHALGVIWYQLLKRDPTAASPVGTEWVEELRPHGFTDSQARVLQACLATRPDKRPRTAAHLAEQLGQVTVGTPVKDGTDGSRLISLKAPSSTHHTPMAATARGKAFDAEAAAAQAAAVLTAVGGGPMAAGGPLSTASMKIAKNTIGMMFTRVSAGTFLMGSADTEPGRRDHEGPPHEVKISRSFYLSVFPVTQAQYEKVAGKNPAKFTKAKGGGPEHPVESVSWKEAEAFCQRLAQLPDEEVHRRSYRLPTEAEWEYACRAGAATAFATGAALAPADAITAASGGKYGGKTTAPVGSDRGNGWGLHDLHGNVQEWVHDWYEEYYYFDGPRDDPPGPGRGVLKVTRGGCWGMPPADCRSAARRPYAPDTRVDTIGFRVVMVVG